MRDNIKGLVAWLSETLGDLDGIVLEAGSFQVKGQEGYADLRPFFHGKLYIGIDQRLGPGVDSIQDIHSLGIKTRNCSWVICLDTLEHVKNPLKTVDELKRVLTSPGILLISSVMDFPIHEHPSDYWRFTPQIFFEMLSGLDARAVLYQGDPRKPHTVIGIGAKGTDLDLAWPEELAGEQLYVLGRDLAENNVQTGRKKRGLRYDYVIDINDTNTSHSKILRQVSPASNVLEIGCATGYMTQYLKEELSCTITAIEVDQAAASLARPFCNELIVGNVEQLDLASLLSRKRFDYIILADILEHLIHPEGVLSKLRSFLKEDGSLLISIPNSTHASLALDLMDGKWDYRQTGLLDATHLRFFTLSSFLSLLERTGFWAITVDRVIIDPWNTEFHSLWSQYPREITAYLEKANPEYRTYQFIIRAVPMGPHGEAELFRENFETARKALAEAKENISGLTGQLHEKEEEIKGFTGQLHEKEEEIKGFTGQLKSLEEKAEIIKGEYERLKKMYQGIEKDLYRARFELSRMEQSLGWRILAPYRKLIERILPNDTGRRRAYQLCTHALAYGLRQGPAALSRKTIDYLKRKRGAKAVKPLPGQMEREWHPLEFPEFKPPPDVSIIIPVYNKALYTFNCLKSIVEHPGERSYEVTVVDDASSDETPRMMEEMKGISHLRSENNMGFVASCNRGAKGAKGRFLVFLNNDTMVTNGWLDALLETFDRFPQVGLAGGKLVYPDGRLQEAGGVIWDDASGMNFGKWDDPERPEYNYVREVDYCSAACIAVPRDLFDSIGGFDTRYSPAYYEDTDLAMEVRKRGFRSLYQPFCTIVHFEGVTAGTDTSSGVKRYQEVNRSKFLEKWREVLSRDHLPPSAPPYLFRERGYKGRILVVDHYVPTPDRDSGSLRLFSIMELMVEYGWKVIFWPDNFAKSEPYTGNLQRLGVEVYYGPRSFSKEIRIMGNYLDAAFVARPHIAPGYIESLRMESKARIIYDSVDLRFVSEERRAKIEGDDAILDEARRWKDVELYLSKSSDKVVVVTRDEKEILEKEGVSEKVVVIPNIHEVTEKIRPFGERKGLMFIGGFLHPPNIDAMLWFVREIFPVLREKLRDLKLTIVGSNPPREIKRLGSSDIEITGYVADVTPFFQGSRVFVSPLRYGAGLKGKIGQSLGFGLPVVTTSIGAEGFNVHDGRAPFLVADRPKEFAEKVLDLYSNEALWNDLSRLGREFIRANFSREAIRPVIHSLLDEVRKKET